VPGWESSLPDVVSNGKIISVQDYNLISQIIVKYLRHSKWLTILSKWFTYSIFLLPKKGHSFGNAILGNNFPVVRCLPCNSGQNLDKPKTSEWTIFLLVISPFCDLKIVLLETGQQCRLSSRGQEEEIICNPFSVVVYFDFNVSTWSNGRLYNWMWMICMKIVLLLY